MTIDPITFSVFRNGLVSAARDMRTMFKRTVMLPIIYEYNDFGMSLYDSQVRLIADAPGIPIFLGSLDFCIEATLAEVGGRDALAEGDVVLSNHPYMTGGHPADAAVFSPIFHEGSIVGFSALRSHIGDTGAKSVYPVDSTEIFQEGTIFPGVKLYDRGRLDDNIIRILKANSRLPTETAGSVLAGAGALRLANQKVAGLLDAYGRTVYEGVVEEIFAHGERTVREAIARIPDGTYSYENHMDDDGVGSDPVKVACDVVIAGSEVTVDLSRSAGVQTGGVNCPWGYTLATARFALKRLTTPELPPNSGEYRPVSVIAPAGSLFNPSPPAASFLGYMTSARLVDVITHALADAQPDIIPAQNGGDLAFVIAIVEDPRTERLSLFFDDSAIGHGAMMGRDGMDALVHCWTAGIEAMPAEIMETRMPLVKRRLELMTDSGGPGQFRGGMAAEAAFEVRGKGSAVSACEKSFASRVEGLWGGWEAPETNSIVFFPDTDRELRLGKKSDIAVAPGDVFIMRPGGGGGVGHPVDREIQAVVDDVKNGYVSLADAERVYGVVFVRDGDDVDIAATDARRSKLRAGAQRGMSRPSAAARPE